MTDPIFVLFAARSGSTLFRVLADTHPEIASPPETRIAAIADSLCYSWRTVSPMAASAPVLGADRMREIARIAAAPMDAYAAQQGKTRWCEKSPDNVTQFRMLAELYPDARFVVLVRHCLDFVVSALDAGRWGFGAYGLKPYARDSPDNLVRAMVTCWCDYTENLLAARTALADRARLVRYEDLVRDPQETMDGVFSFLGVPPVEDIAATAFTTYHDIGPGDHKLMFTDAVHDRRVGTGRQVPVDLIGTGLMQRMNAALIAAGYPEVGPDWNEGTHAVPDPSAASSARAGHAVLGPAAPEPEPCAHEPAPHRTGILLEDLGVYWTVDPAGPRLVRCERACAAESRIITDSATLRELVSGTGNIGGAIRAGTLRATVGASVLAGVVEALRTVVPAPLG
ncbi:sulfotransferase [Amycolatopsis sp. NBC_01488]|uniref:sulfotransferase family protein n=1 Tax=Amycolatopsis sp. NBC_01488 TaxID=2903563 RepID=UPI002E2BBB3D|nr:sulfotransferase [Amycolatopsis sp. NBC_01488]